MALLSDLLAAAQALKPELVADRRTLHQQPELGYEEHQTAAFITARLRQLGLTDIRTSVGGTGVVALLRGSQPGKTVLLRADMDALPILEQNDLPFVSQNPGVMHACGHDGHMAMLLGVARLLATRRERLQGTVKFMFQPAEEGGAGAMRMLEDGLLDHPAVDAAFGLHIHPNYDAGQVALRPGPAMASTDRFTITVRGRGGHAAMPHQTVDPIAVAAHIVTALQTIVSREVSALEPAVVTVGSLTAGTTHNVIPDTATILGTVRAFNEAVRAAIAQRIGELAAGIAGAMRASVDWEYRMGYPPVVNDPALAALAGDALREALGPEAVVEQEPWMVAEDFAFVLQRVPGVFFFLGVRDPAWSAPRMNHSATFDLSEDALPVGTAALAATALRFLHGEE